MSIWYNIVALLNFFIKYMQFIQLSSRRCLNQVMKIAIMLQSLILSQILHILCRAQELFSPQQALISANLL
jgi:hypothetical protein